MRSAACLLLALLAWPCPGRAEPAVERQEQLLRMLRQDCGSCHGMRLTGGLGPALTAEALQGKPWQSLSATIFHGRPGTPMPPWKSMLSSEEADWLALQLLSPLQAGAMPAEAVPRRQP
ncbi:MAG TPA: cytochrome c [Burkholderiaceae bacterium]|nr:cytochrome c [Burkholderiaceae bacterium]